MTIPNPMVSAIAPSLLVQKERQKDAGKKQRGGMNKRIERQCISAAVRA